MREVKFRGQSINGDWHIGLVAKKDGNYFISNSSDKPFAYQVGSQSIGQFTGMKDKNGVDIYEGDIVLSKRPYILDKDNSCIGAVEFSNKIFGFVFIRNYDSKTMRLDHNGYEDTIEVIGNIYEKGERAAI